MTPSTQRNLGFVTEEQQATIARSCVAIAGAGGDGGKLAVTLARLGIGSLRLADPEVFEVENLNRQAACTTSTLGRNKAEVVAELVLAINPSMQVEVLDAGVTSDNVDAFARGADVVADETEFTMHDLGVQIARAARTAGVPVVMGLNIGFGCLITSFTSESLTFEEYLGLDPRADLDSIASAEVDLWRWVPRVPTYTGASVLAGVADGTVSAPTVAPGVDLCAGILATEVLAHILGIRPPVLAPETLVFDAVDLTFERISDRESSFGASLERIFG